MIPFEITDGQVDLIAGQFGCDLQSPARRAALKARGPIDVQAAPGSGKTTLVAAKLAIMASKWPWSDRGVCVLSHTNVARTEITKRLMDSPIGRGLLGYPHYIGTIQTFVDQYLALPFLRSRGYQVTVIDNGEFTDRVRRAVEYDHILRAFCQPRADRLPMICSLRYVGANLEIAPAIGGLPGPNTQSFARCMALKQRLTQEGYYRYDDMFAFSLAHMQMTPTISAALRWRFPVVIIDEMQDTNALQDSVIAAGFGPEHCLQRFGDINQAIFHGDDMDNAGTTFPREGATTIDDSRRFDSHIAGIATRLALRSPQVITGRQLIEGTRHTLIIFDDATIGSVLPTFGDIVLDHAPAGEQGDWVCKAIGYRRAGDAQRLPRHIGDYWPAWGGQERLIDQPAASLLLASRQAASMTLSTGHTDLSLQIVWRALIHWFRVAGMVLPGDVRLTRRGVTGVIEAQPNGGAGFRQLLRSMVMPSAFNNEGWQALAAALVEEVHAWIPAQLSAEAVAYLAWQEEAPEEEPEADVARHDLYRHERAGRAIDIHIGTTHSVKGETHHATLVLETQKRHIFDGQEVAPFLGADPGARQPRNQTAAEMLRVMFVSVSRPSRLLCMAIHKDHVPVVSWDELHARGWQIRDITGHN